MDADDGDLQPPPRPVAKAGQQRLERQAGGSTGQPGAASIDAEPAAKDFDDELPR